MGLTSWLRRTGAARPHVLVAAVPGGTEVRLAAEEELRRRGWPAALTPADADVLLVAGTPTAGIAGAVEAAWAAVPAPHVRVQVTQPDEVAAALNTAQADLAAGAGSGDVHHFHDATTDSHDGNGMSDMDMASHGMGDMAMDAHHDDAMTGDHHGMGDMDMDMGMPGGLPMARRGEDRDGLKLDRLHVPLGPILPDWPAGLVVRLTLQGDVVQQVDAAAVGLATGTGSFWTEPWRQAAAGAPVSIDVAARRRAAAHLDSLARFLAVAGWDDATTAARRLRDDTLHGRPASSLGPAVRGLAARVARSRLLAWSTRGLGMLSAEDAAAGIDGSLRAAGDVTARYRRWCGDLAEVTARLDDGGRMEPGDLEPPRGRIDAAQAPSAALLAVLPRLLTGVEFAAARLIVASLDPDLDERPARMGAGHDH